MKKTTSIYYFGQNFKIEYIYESLEKSISIESINGINNPEDFFREGVIDDLILLVAEEEINFAVDKKESLAEARGDEERGN